MSDLINRKICLLHIVLICFVALLAFGNALSNEFVWDDYLNIVHNRMITSRENLPRLFDRSYLTHPDQLMDVGSADYGSGELSYRPVVTLTYFVDHALWQLEPLGYHLTSLALHVLAAVVVYLLLQLFFASTRWALWGALLYAVHPVQSEAVMIPAFREDVLAGLFYFVSFYQYVRYRSGKAGALGMMIGLASFLLAVFSKEMAVTLPVVCVVYDVMFGRGKGWRDFLRTRWRGYAGFAAVMCFYFWVWAGPMARQYGSDVTWPAGSLAVNLLTMIKVVGIYAWWLVFPIGLHPTLPDEGLWVMSVFDPGFLLGLLVVSLVGFLMWRFRAKNQAVSFGLLWFFVTLLPVLNIIPIYNLMAMRYLYLPLVGLCIFVVAWAREIFGADLKRFKQVSVNTKLVAGMGIVLFYVLMTWSYGYTFKNELAFRMVMINHYDDNFRAYRGLSSAYLQLNKLDEALAAAQKVKELKPDDVNIYVDLAGMYARQGKLDEAISELKEAVRREPDHAAGALMLCSMYGQKHDYTKAVECFEGFVARHPDRPEGYYNLGVTFLNLGREQKAREVFEKAGEIDPDFRLGHEARNKEVDAHQ